MSSCEFRPSRRAVLGSAGALFGWSFAPRFAHAAGGRDMRFICVILRGAVDGLSLAPPLGDPDYAGLRESIALTRDGHTPALPLDGFFGLHPAMPNLARLYRANQALVVHAVATGYRERSHFAGQDVLESGQPGPGRTESGWLNRLVAGLPPGERISGADLLGIGTVAPLIVRGPAPVSGWAPPVVRTADEDLATRLLDLYVHRDPILAEALSRGLQMRAVAGARGMDGAPGPAPGANTPAGMRHIAEAAARLVAAEDGPRIAALAFEGWDTHANEGGATGRLAQLLGGLDGALAAFETELKERWTDTVVLVMTEFGRTARLNGTVGTDHGTGTVAVLAGGAVKGGRVLADWPGLRPADLYEGRDLTATTDLRAIAKGVVSELFGSSRHRLGRDIFPGTEAMKPVGGLIV